jgi:hypothetical protein
VNLRDLPYGANGIIAPGTVHTPNAAPHNARLCIFRLFQHHSAGGAPPRFFVAHQLLEIGLPSTDPLEMGRVTSLAPLGITCGSPALPYSRERIESPFAAALEVPGK